MHSNLMPATQMLGQKTNQTPFQRRINWLISTGERFNRSQAGMG